MLSFPLQLKRLLHRHEEQRVSHDNNQGDNYKAKQGRKSLEKRQSNFNIAKESIPPGKSADSELKADPDKRYEKGIGAPAPTGPVDSPTQNGA